MLSGPLAKSSIRPSWLEIAWRRSAPEVSPVSPPSSTGCQSSDHLVSSRSLRYWARYQTAPEVMLEAKTVRTLFWSPATIGRFHSFEFPILSQDDQPPCTLRSCFLTHTSLPV